MPTYDPKLQSLIDRAGRLYSLPAVAMAVLALTSRPAIDSTSLKECIENDPALAAKILKVVNSSLFGLSRQVGDLNQAIALLGVKPLKLLVLGFSLPETLLENMTAEMLTRYWRRSLTRAVAARQLSEQFWNLPGDEAFLAGLLRGVGELVLVQQVGQAYVDFVAKVQSENGNRYALETRSLGFDHTELSAGLLEQWNLPESLVAAATFVEPRDAHDEPLTLILYLAELVADTLVDQSAEAMQSLFDSALALRGVKSPEVERLMTSLQDRVAQLAEVLSLDLPSGIDVTDLLVRAHAALADAAEDVIGAALAGRTADGGDTSSLLAEVQALADVVAQVAGADADDPTTTENFVNQQSGSAEAATQPSAPPGAESQTVSTAVAPVVTDDPGLLGRVGSHASQCRHDRSPLTLLLVEIDRFAEVTMTGGPSVAARLVEVLLAACKATAADHADVLHTGDGLAALLLPGCDRTAAVEHAQRLVRTVPTLFHNHLGEMTDDVTISSGAATITLLPKNFSPRELVDRAERCLYGARNSGGGNVKSIEII